MLGSKCSVLMMWPTFYGNIPEAQGALSPTSALAKSVREGNSFIAWHHLSLVYFHLLNISCPHYHPLPKYSFKQVLVDSVEFIGWRGRGFFSWKTERVLTADTYW